MNQLGVVSNVWLHLEIQTVMHVCTAIDSTLKGYLSQFYILPYIDTYIPFTSYPFYVQLMTVLS